MLLQTKDVDVLRVSWAYLYFCGDVTRTAVACSCSPLVVEQLAAEHNWPAQLETLGSIRAVVRGSEDEQKKINREINFLQAGRLRELVDRVVGYLSDADREGFESFFTAVDKKGNPIPNMKALFELVKSAETVQAMTYAALGDKQAAEAVEQGSERVAELGLSVAKALNTLLERSPIADKGSAMPVVREVVLDLPRNA